jgi:F-type H+-transporting ATPase subunit alpha
MPKKIKINIIYLPRTNPTIYLTTSLIKVSNQLEPLWKSNIRLLKQQKKQSSGLVISVKDGIVVAKNLPTVFSGEVVCIGKDSIKGIILTLKHRSISIVLLGKDISIKQSDKVIRTKKVMEMGLTTKLFGRVISPLGLTIDGLVLIKTNVHRKIDTKAIGIIPRKSVHEPMQTGIISVDSIIPIGLGQRELIIGDRQTGKTTIGLDTIMNQRLNGILYSIYVAIGQKKSTICQIVTIFNKTKSSERTIVVAAFSSDPASLQFLSPYSGCALGEWISENTAKALIIYDDLSKHAVAHRQVSLLLRRPPGREAYPGDIFFIHSRLLERAAKYASLYGLGSLTALPIVETQGGDVSAYIPTNIISITDGQIFLESKLFNEGIRPAINIGLSVSRVGSAAQPNFMKAIASTLKLELAQYREIQSFSSFASELDAETQHILFRGLLLIEIFKQKDCTPMTVETQILILYAAKNNLIPTLNVHMGRFKIGIRKHMRQTNVLIGLDCIKKGNPLSMAKFLMPEYLGKIG